MVFNVVGGSFTTALLIVSAIFCRMDSEDKSAWEPSSHVIFRAARPWMEDHVSSATTATPLLTLTTARTPATASAWVESYLTSFPPSVGQRATVANNMPGKRTSNP